MCLANEEALQGAISPLTVLGWKSKKLPRVARSSAAAETQAAGTAEEESEYTRLTLSSILYGQRPLSEWTETCKKVPAALVLDCKCLFDALSRSETTALGLADVRSAIEALALRQGMHQTGATLKWVHSHGQVADAFTKDSQEARGAYEELVKKGFYWRLVHDSEYTSAKRRLKLGLGRLDAVPKNKDEGQETSQATSVQAEIQLETGKIYGATAWQECAWQLLEIACPVLRTLYEPTDLEKYTEPVIHAWETHDRKLRGRMQPPTSWHRKTSRSSPTGACEISRHRRAFL